MERDDYKILNRIIQAGSPSWMLKCWPTNSMASTI